jgi:hypothetical protein
MRVQMSQFIEHRPVLDEEEAAGTRIERQVLRKPLLRCSVVKEGRNRNAAPARASL